MPSTHARTSRPRTRSITIPVTLAPQQARERFTRVVALALLVLTAAGCASKPIEIDDAAITVEPVTPSQVAANPDPVRGTVLWGGTIIGAVNLKSGSQLELLGYPLDRTQRPQVERPSQGRFIITSNDYLETVDFAEGRQVTVLGDLNGLEEVTIGEARRELPVVRAKQLHLWTGTSVRGRTGFSFGIGVGSGGGTRSGVGVGIGL